MQYPDLGVVRSGITKVPSGSLSRTSITSGFSRPMMGLSKDGDSDHGIT